MGIALLKLLPNFDLPVAIAQEHAHIKASLWEMHPPDSTALLLDSTWAQIHQAV